MKVFIPRIVNESAYNAQNLNAKAMLSKWTNDEWKFSALCTDKVNHSLLQHEIYPLWKWRFREFDVFRRYLKSYDAIFYPGVHWFDYFGLKFKKLLCRGKCPAIGTLEGIPWMADNVRRSLEEKVGHEIITMGENATPYYIEVLRKCDHIIAISPFLAKVGEHLLGEKFSVLPLGVELSTFYASPDTKKNSRITVVSAGTVYERKRPELFLALAAAVPDADFKWYGAARGDLLQQLLRKQERLDITNLEFMGQVSPQQLSDVFRKADLFVLPSLSEGVPKVSQEAAACGLPLVLFGHYEAPTVVHGENGYIVWNDDEFIEIVAAMTKDREMLRAMGERSATMAKSWDWTLVAPEWLRTIQMVVEMVRK